MSPSPSRPPTDACRCYSCGDPEPMGCGTLCADCSWEDHLSAMGHTGESRLEAPPDPDTPDCCLRTRREITAYWAMP